LLLPVSVSSNNLLSMIA